MLRPPVMNDGLRFYLFMPWKSSLYGANDIPAQWLRVVTQSVTPSSKNIMSVSNGEKIVTANVYTISNVYFFNALSYGASEYIEPAVTRLDNLNGISSLYENPNQLMTQAVYRSYQKRLEILLKTIKQSQHSLFKNQNAYNTLIKEALGVCVCWQSLMNGNGLHPLNCIYRIDENNQSVKEKINNIQECYDNLTSRLCHSNFNYYPLSKTNTERINFLKSFGINF